MPYSQAQANALDGLIDTMNSEPLAFIVHVGDITSGSGPCDDAWLEARRRQFARWRAPLVLLPGDNEWTDCHRSGFDPLERLRKWRSLFCAGGAALRLERQAGEYCEHVRWTHEGILFVALNVPGSNNNLGRNARMDAEHAGRMRAVLAWIDSSVALAQEQRLRGVVVLMHANPRFGRGTGADANDGYAALREALASQTARLHGRLVLVHGDTHLFRDDRPLPGLRRIEVFGSPFMYWLRAATSERGSDSQDHQDFLTVESVF